MQHYIDQRGWKVIEHPPQSLDLNVIEHLWDEIDRRIDRIEVKTIEQLKAKIKEVGNLLQPEITQKLVKSMPRRLQQVIE